MPTTTQNQTPAGAALPAMYDLCPSGDDIWWPGADEYYAAAPDGDTYRSFLNGGLWDKTLPEVLAIIATLKGGAQ